MDLEWFWGGFSSGSKNGFVRQAQQAFSYQDGEIVQNVSISRAVRRGFDTFRCVYAEMYHFSSAIEAKIDTFHNKIREYAENSF